MTDELKQDIYNTKISILHFIQNAVDNTAMGLSANELRIYADIVAQLEREQASAQLKPVLPPPFAGLFGGGLNG